MEGHEQLRAAILTHLQDALPTHLAGVRNRLGVSSPRDPEAYLLGDTLQVLTRYPCVMVRTTRAPKLVDAGAGQMVVRYDVEVVVAVEVPRSGAFDVASVERDRLSLAVRWALLGPSNTLPPEVTLSVGGLTEDHGPSAESVNGRPLAVGVTSFAAVVVEQAPDLGGWESVGAVDVSVRPYSAGEEI